MNLSKWKLASVAAAALMTTILGCGNGLEVRFSEDLIEDKPIDFARLEAELPLTVEERMSITPENLKDLNQEQVDQIYGRLTVGPIPDGPYDGDLFFARGDDSETRVAEILGGG